MNSICFRQRDFGALPARLSGSVSSSYDMSQKKQPAVLLTLLCPSDSQSLVMGGDGRGMGSRGGLWPGRGRDCGRRRRSTDQILPMGLYGLPACVSSPNHYFPFGLARGGRVLTSEPGLVGMGCCRQSTNKTLLPPSTSRLAPSKAVRLTFSPMCPGGTVPDQSAAGAAVGPTELKDSTRRKREIKERKLTCEWYRLSRCLN
jgi:hypothetical protein